MGVSVVGDEAVFPPALSLQSSDVALVREDGRLKSGAEAGQAALDQWRTLLERHPSQVPRRVSNHFEPFSAPAPELQSSSALHGHPP